MSEDPQQSDGDVEAAGDLTRFLRHELVVLVLLSGVAAAGFLGTRAMAQVTARQERADAFRWYERGRARLAAGDAAGAVTVLRQAVFRSHDSWLYAEALSAALAESGAHESARQFLTQWRGREPSNPQVLVRLAHLEAAAGRVADATSAYEGALYGQWPADAAAGRAAVRRELIRFLLDHGDRAGALSQILALGASQADTAGSYIDTGRLLLEAGDPARALEQFQRALRVTPGNAAAMAGAGGAAFQLGDEAGALRFLSALDDEESRALASRARASVEADPLGRGVSPSVRRQRLLAALAYVEGRVAACGAPGDAVEALASFRRGLPRGQSLRDTEVIEEGLHLVGATVRRLPSGCAADDRDDVYLRVAARHQRPTA